MDKQLAPLTQGEQNTLRTTNVGRYVILGDNTRVVVINVSRITQGKICMRCVHICGAARDQTDLTGSPLSSRLTILTEETNLLKKTKKNESY